MPSYFPFPQLSLLLPEPGLWVDGRRAGLRAAPLGHQEVRLPEDPGQDDTVRGQSPLVGSSSYLQILFFSAFRSRRIWWPRATVVIRPRRSRTSPKSKKYIINFANILL